MKKLLSIIITITMVLSLNAASLQMAFADTGEGTPANPNTPPAEDAVTVYFTLSNDGRFVTGNDSDETVLCHVPVTISYFDLAEYDMEDFYRYEADSFEAGGGYNGDTVITTPTVLHLYIKMLEKYYLGDGRKLKIGDDEQNALKISGSATSLYMTTFWNHDENLMYYVNHAYPLQAKGWGSTCDYILLEDGMDIDVAMFSDWDFYHTGAFAYFDSPDQTKNDKGQFVTTVGKPITLTMRATATNAANDGESSFVGEPMPDEVVTYANKKNAVSEYDNNEWDAADNPTDEDGNITLTFDKPGTYFVSSTSDYVNYEMESGNACVAPPIAEVKVLNDDGTDSDEPVTDPDNPGTDPDNPGTNPDNPDFGKDDYTGALIDDVTFHQTQSLVSAEYTIEDDTVIVPDTKSAVSAFTSLTEDAPERTTFTATYTTINGSEKNVELKKNNNTGTALSKFLDKSGKGNTLTITASCKNEAAEDNVETRTIRFDRSLSLSGLSAVDDAGEIVEFDEAFAADRYEYNTSIPADVSKINVTAIPYKDDYDVTVTGEDTDTVIITVSTEDYTQEYKINVIKKDTVSQQFITTDGTILQIRNSNKTAVCQEQVAGESCTVTGLIEGKEYTYTATKKEYSGKSGSFISGENETIDLTLTPAKVNESIVSDIPSSWSDFRGHGSNNGITNTLLPTTHENAQLYWATKVGEGYGAGAPSSPIIVDDCLIYTTANTIVKVDKTTGEVLKSGKMSRTSAFNITPPTYADGMIFVALAAGTIEAFNADTLESLWVYHNPNRGQPNCPITYHDGYIYTGFWSGESIKADFVCLSASDEDPSRNDEEKIATWTYTKVGGFYWAGAYACDDFVLVTTDDGAASDSEGFGSLISFNPRTGKVLSRNDSIKGDCRSTICYDEATDKYYFTSKGGSFCAATVDEDGQITLLETIDLEGASTSTPVVSNGRAYVGVNGTEQFGVNSGHCIKVINLEDMTVAYKLLTRGYPQTSGLLTTGYEQKPESGNKEDDETYGYTYVYFIDNYEPGKVRVLKDKPGQTDAIITRVSEYDDDNDNNVLFTPKNDQANYAICSPIADTDGTMYFKNDSGYMFALGSKIRSIEITKSPDKTDYVSGEKFDPAGMEVIADLENGLTRDISKYISYPDKPLTEEDTYVQIKYTYYSYNDTLSVYDHFKDLIDDVKVAVTNSEELAKIKQLVGLIDAIPQKITLDSYKTIEAARQAYENLDVSTTVFDKYLTNYDRLLEAEETYGELLSEYLKANTLTVKAASAGFDSARLSWNTLRYNFVYDVYKLDAKGKYRYVSRTSESQYTDSKLTCGKEYSYMVKPVFLLTDGKTKLAEGTSDAVTVTPEIGNVTLSSAKKGSKNNMVLSWQQVPGAEGYVIYRSDAENGTYKSIYTVANGEILTNTNTGLKCEGSYYYKVKAYRIVNGKQQLSRNYSQTLGTSKLGHTCSDVLVKATDTKDGKTASKCSVCDTEVKSKTIYKASGINISASTYVWDGTEKKPAVTVKDSKGNTIAKENYSISYSSGRKNVGKYTVTVNLKGKYTGTVKKTYVINPKGTSISKLTAAKEGFKATWKKQAVQTTGYQIRYSQKSSMSGAGTVTVSKTGTVSKSVRKLKAKKKYYVQVRTYKTVSGVKYYSKWSSVKSITTK